MTRALGRSGFRGVTENGEGFRAEIYVKGKRINIGTFTTAIEAAEAWDKAALYYFGERSDLNFPIHEHVHQGERVTDNDPRE